jgi:hypothetical protein
MNENYQNINDCYYKTDNEYKNLLETKEKILLELQ